MFRSSYNIDDTVMVALQVIQWDSTLLYLTQGGKISIQRGL